MQWRGQERRHFAFRLLSRLETLVMKRSVPVLVGSLGALSLVCATLADVPPSARAASASALASTSGAKALASKPSATLDAKDIDAKFSKRMSGATARATLTALGFEGAGGGYVSETDTIVVGQSIQNLDTDADNERVVRISSCSTCGPGEASRHFLAWLDPVGSKLAVVGRTFCSGLTYAMKHESIKISFVNVHSSKVLDTLVECEEWDAGGRYTASTHLSTLERGTMDVLLMETWPGYGTVESTGTPPYPISAPKVWGGTAMDTYQFDESSFQYLRPVSTPVSTPISIVTTVVPSVVTSPSSAADGINPCPASCSGTPTPDLVASIKLRADTTKQCYKALVDEKPPIAGAMDFTVRVGTNGQACSVLLTRDTTGSAKLGQCVRQRMTVKYPAPSSGCVDVAGSISFRPSDSPAGATSVSTPSIATAPPTVTSATPDATATPPPIVFTVGRATGAGRIAGADATVDKIRWKFRACTKKARSSDPSASGAIVVRVQVGATGVATTASAASSTASTSLTHCVVDAFEGLEFAAPSGGATELRVPVTIAPP